MNNEPLKKMWRAMTSGALAALTMMAFVSPAMAEGNETIIIFTPGLFTTTTTGVVLTAVDGVSSTTSSTTDAIFDCDQAQVYMDANAVALSQEITMGGGQTVTDLAGMAGIEPGDRAAFAKMLRTQHASLVPLLEDEVSREDAEAFTRIISEAMKQDESLSKYLPAA
ncbi:MAG: DUF3015 family protein [Myxococcota bacterium]|nr:DUF3015 family protein [Myxococcota bacterium]